MLKKFVSSAIAIGLSLILVNAAAYSAERKVIIGFHNPPGPAEHAMILDAGGKIKKRFRHLRAISADILDSEVDALRSNPEVAYIEEDALIQAIDPLAGGIRSLLSMAQATGLEYENAWSVSHIGSQVPHDRGVAGAGIKIAVLDTGIDYNHPDLDMNYAGGENFISIDPDNHDPFDDSFNSHGTHVAGTIAAELDGAGVVGVAPEASIYAVKVLDGAGFGSVSGVVAGIDWAVANQMDIINLSMGFTTYYQSLADVCEAANAAGLVVIAAAGNSYGGPVLYPAALPSVIAVGATTIFDDVGFMSANGPEIELTAPGLNVNSTIANAGYGFLGGTSQAAPHVTGVAALLMSLGVGDIDGNGIEDNNDIRMQMRLTALDLGDPGVDTIFGYGLVTAPEPVVEDPVTHLIVDKLKGHSKKSKKTATIEDGVFEVRIVNTGLSQIKVKVYEDGEKRCNLSEKYKFRKKSAPQEVVFDIDATGTGFDLIFAPKGEVGSFADVYIQMR
ncbi:MAG: S8 family peptidase [Candidatus Thiodiazotropha sp. (ex Epidulcina cf. delphinae)]|nr:S8 family peptidase [Candidatus Thiodiazotropha sp. (ex Epidulcina cf. delphinae)]